MVFRGFPHAQIIGLCERIFREQFYLFWPLVCAEGLQRTLIQISIGCCRGCFVRLILLPQTEEGTYLV